MRSAFSPFSRSPFALALALSPLALLAGCSEPLPGTPTPASALCSQVANIVCEADTRCFGGTTEREDCVADQLIACTRSVGALATDSRLGYDPARGGAFLEGLRESAQGCWQTPIDVDAFRDVFEGTGVDGTNCTPASTGSQDLLLASLSCGEGLACRVQLRTDSSTEGVCRPRRDSTCSHAWDCSAGEYCSLPTRWQPGVWGECRPRHVDGWECTSDLECESLHCSGTCRAAVTEDLALSITYPKLVEAASPAAYFRLDEESGARADEVGGTPAAAAGGAVGRLEEGALADDEDGAATLSGGSYLRANAPTALQNSEALTLECWFRADEPLAVAPLLEFAAGDGFGVSLGLIGDGTRLEGNFRDRAATDHPAQSGSGAVSANTWHHAVATYDGRTGTIYLDGRRVGTAELAGRLRVDEDLLIGFHPAHEDDEARSFSGAIDEVAVYAHGMNAETVRRHYDAGQSGTIENTFPLFDWAR